MGAKSDDLKDRYTNEESQLVFKKCATQGLRILSINFVPKNECPDVIEAIKCDLDFMDNEMHVEAIEEHD